MPTIEKMQELHSGFRFTVKIDGKDFAAFTDCTLPNLQVETQDINEGGVNEYVHRLPVRVKVGTVTLKHGITKNSELMRWYLQVRDGKIEAATRTVSVVMFDSLLKPVATWTFNRAYPIKWVGPQLKSGDSAAAIEELELAHHGFEVE